MPLSSVFKLLRLARVSESLAVLASLALPLSGYVMSMGVGDWKVKRFLGFLRKFPDIRVFPAIMPGNRWPSPSLSLSYVVPSWWLGWVGLGWVGEAPPSSTSSSRRGGVRGRGVLDVVRGEAP